MLLLKVITGPAAGQTVEVEHEIVIGREGADLMIDDPEMSRRHTAVRPTADGVEVEDLGSTNGTFVNDSRIAGITALRASATLRVGLTNLAIELTEDRTVLRAAPARGRPEADDESSKPVVPDLDVTAARSKPVVPDLDVTAARSKPVVPDPEATTLRAKPVVPDLDATALRAKPVVPEAEPASAAPEPLTSEPDDRRAPRWRGWRRPRHNAADLELAAARVEITRLEETVKEQAIELATLRRSQRLGS